MSPLHLTIQKTRDNPQKKKKKKEQREDEENQLCAHILQPMTRPRQTQKKKKKQHHIPHTTPMLAHRQETDSTQQDDEGGTEYDDQDHHTTGTQHPSSSLPAALPPVVPARFGGRALTMSDETTRHRQIGEDNLLYLKTAGSSKHLQGRWADGGWDPSSVQLLTRGRRKPGSQGERGIGPRFIGRTCVTTTIGNRLRSNKMIQKKKKKKKKRVMRVSQDKI
jgi:hypothetical protein